MDRNLENFAAAALALWGQRRAVGVVPEIIH
jgi:hypothetical protein